jgi:hypothetical protein
VLALCFSEYVSSEAKLNLMRLNLIFHICINICFESLKCSICLSGIPDTYNLFVVLKVFSTVVMHNLK